MWDFYFFFFKEAITVSKLLDVRLAIRSDGRVSCGLPNRMFREKVNILLEQGIKIALVERVSDRLEILKKKESNAKQDELVRRELCQILTRGTYIDHNELDYSARYSICVFEYINNFGVVFLDTTVQDFYIGEFKDDEQKSNLRTLLTRIKPIEIIYYNEYITEESINIFKGLSTKPSRTPMTLIKPRPFEILINSIKNLKPTMPDILAEMINQVNTDLKSTIILKNENIPNFYLFQALGLCIEYLEDIMLANTVFSMGTFHKIDLQFEKRATLYLDSQALENLEILDVGYLNVLSETYSLFGYMDQTASPYGRRLFKRWVTSPLLDPAMIEARIEAVDDFIMNPDIVNIF
jgi:DNA mismatch repair protein MSH6